MRLFNRRGPADATEAGRIPPGQHVVRELPVLHLGATPAFDETRWDLSLFGLVARETTLTYADLCALPAREINVDIHCVTTWSVLDTTWAGVRFADVAALAQPLPAARFVLAHAENGYTTNLPLPALMDDDVLLAYGYGGLPLAPRHGYPLRLVVPKLYFWKSAKWVRALEFLTDDQPGFWESRGYHNQGDPWKEQRYG